MGWKVNLHWPLDREKEGWLVVVHCGTHPLGTDKDETE